MAIGCRIFSKYLKAEIEKNNLLYLSGFECCFFLHQLRHLYFFFYLWWIVLIHFIKAYLMLHSLKKSLLVRLIYPFFAELKLANIFGIFVTMFMKDIVLYFYFLVISLLGFALSLCWLLLQRILQGWEYFFFKCW